MTATFRVGTRGSALALAQAEAVGSALTSRHRSLDVVLVPLVTSGDRHRVGARQGDFTDRIDEALERGEVDAAVHSAKDLPSVGRKGVVVAAYPPREDPRDALVGARPTAFRALARGARIGSSSARRRAQILRRRPDLNVVELVGNVDSRLRRVQDGTLDGAVLAWAGLRRLGRSAEASEVFPTRTLLPAPGQGALAVETRSSDHRARRLVGTLDDRATRLAVASERAFVAAMGGDCSIPLAALARIRGSYLRLRAEVYSPDGSEKLACEVRGAAGDTRRLARRAAENLARRGASRLWGVEATSESR